MVCIVVGAAFLAFGGDRVGDVYSKLAPSAEAFTSRIDDEAVLDNVVNGVHKAAADAASRPGFERSSFSAAEGEGCLLYTSPSPRDKRQSRMPSSA